MERTERAIPAPSIDASRISPKSVRRAKRPLATVGSTPLTVGSQYSSRPGHKKCSSSAILGVMSLPALVQLCGILLYRMLAILYQRVKYAAKTWPQEHARRTWAAGEDNE